MKSLLQISIVCLFTFLMTQLSGQEIKLDTSTTTNLATGLSTYQVFEYDLENNREIMSHVIAEGSQGNTTITQKTTTDYYTQGMVKSETTSVQDTTNEEYDLSLRLSYQYGSDGVTSEVTEEYDNSSSSWDTTGIINYNYEQGKLKSTETLELKSGTLGKSSKEVYSYIPTTELVDTIKVYEYQNSYQISSYSVNKYNDEDQLIKVVNYDPDWNQTGILTFNYDDVGNIDYYNVFTGFVNLRLDYYYDKDVLLSEVLMPNSNIGSTDLITQNINKVDSFKVSDIDGDGNVINTVLKVHQHYSDIMTATTSVEKLNAKIYPNPASDMVLIELPQYSQADFQLYNLSGELIKDIDVIDGEEIQLNNLNSGMYLYNIKSAHKSKSGKLMIEY